MIIIFEKFRSPDLRKIPEVVYCIKDFYFKYIKDTQAHTKGTVINFFKDKYYDVKGLYGDPQGSIEKYGINDYVPVELINRVVLEDEYGSRYEFEINLDEKFPRFGNKKFPNFFDYFEIPDFTVSTKNYNL